MQALIFTDYNSHCIFFNKNNIEKYIKKGDSIILDYKSFTEYKPLITKLCKKIYIIFNDTEIIPHYLADKIIIPCKASSMQLNPNTYKIIGSKHFINKMILYSSEILVHRDKKIHSYNKTSKTTSFDKNNQFELVSYSEDKYSEERLYIRH